MMGIQLTTYQLHHMDDMQNIEMDVLSNGNYGVLFRTGQMIEHEREYSIGQLEQMADDCVAWTNDTAPTNGTRHSVGYMS